MTPNATGEDGTFLGIEEEEEEAGLEQEERGLLHQIRSSSQDPLTAAAAEDDPDLVNLHELDEQLHLLRSRHRMKKSVQANTLLDQARGSAAKASRQKKGGGDKQGAATSVAKAAGAGNERR